MQISLHEVFPDFIGRATVAGSQVWGKLVGFNKGEHIHIIAPSGSGKTSLIHFLYGLRSDYTGSIAYDNSDIRNFDASRFALWRQQHISIVFQDLRLFPEHTVWQNIEVKRSLRPFHKTNKIVEMAGRLGIEDKLTNICKTCSYGEQQRIAIIRALQQPFDFLLLDEPFSHLDEKNRQKAMQLMADESSERSATIILADLREIEYFKSERTLHL
jgi:putative ABC transport system ATP-binding protein